MRSRNIKPGFFQNEDLVELPPETRLLFIGLWCCADREGRLEDRPKKIKMQVFPADDFDVDAALTNLQCANLISRYEVNGSRFIQIYNFVKHQNPHHKEAASVIPAQEGHIDSAGVPSEVTPGQRQRIFDRDGHKCLACQSTENLQVDHIVPVSMGGHSGDDNLQTLCQPCNASKGNRSCTNHRRAVNAPTITPNAPLIPDSLIPDSLIPERARKRAPPDYSPSSEVMDALCAETGYGTPELETMLRMMKDHTFRTARKDWDAVFRNWVRREKKIETRKRGSQFDDIHAENRRAAGLD